MAKQSIQLQSPIKGVNRVFARGQQPDGTCYDALNMLPFDRYGRLRASQRSGTSKLFANALGDGSQRVGLLAQVVWAGNPDYLLVDNFTYANGALDTVSGGVWESKAEAGAGMNLALGGLPGTNYATVSTNEARNNMASQSETCISTVPLTLGSLYGVQITSPRPTTAVKSSPVVRFNENATGANRGIYCAKSGNFYALYNGAGGQIAIGTISVAEVSGASYTLKILVDETTNLISVFRDGDAVVSAVTTVGAGNTGVGFLIGDAGPNVDDFKVTRETDLVTPRETSLIAVCGGNIYEGDLTAVTVAVNGTGAMWLQLSAWPQMTALAGVCYFVDGQRTRTLTLSTRLVALLTTTAGTYPPHCRLTCGYRGRLVLAGPKDFPQNFYFSKVGDPTNWDYAATGADAAFAGNASTAGQIGDVLTALIPMSDDVMFFGGDHTIWAMKGDPRAGGSIDLVSSAVGVLGAQAWCKDPQDTLYFVGTGGLYKIPAGTTVPLLLSADKFPQAFAAINRATHAVTMAWDRDKFGCFIFITPYTTGAATHMWYDARTDSLWPIQFPNSTGPLSCLVYDGDGPSDRMLLMGGQTGFIQKLNSTVRTDDGTAISSYLVLGPFHPNAGDSILTSGILDFGEVFTGGAATEFNATVTFRAGITAYNVTEGTPDRTAAITFTRDRRGKKFQQRIRGEWFTVKLTNAVSDKYFGFEGGQLDFEPAGLNRGQR